MTPDGKTDGSNKPNQNDGLPSGIRWSTRAENSRSVSARYEYIHNQLRANAYPNATTLAAALGVKRGTIYRDIDDMKTNLDMPIEFDSKKNGYYYSEPVDYCPTLRVKEGDLLTLVLGQKVLDQCHSPHNQQIVRKTLKTLAQTFKESVTFDLDDYDEVISVRRSFAAKFDSELIFTLAKAALYRKQLNMKYGTPNEEPGERIFNPYHVCRVDQDWYVIGYDFKRCEERRFALSRILGLTETGERFVRPAEFTVEGFLKGGVGIYSSGKEYDVIVRYRKKVAYLVREMVFNVESKLIELPNGEVELRLKLSSLEDISRHIAKYEGDVYPISPPELIERYRCAAKKMLGNFSA